MAAAPSLVSSPGWKRRTTVPDQASRLPASRVAAPIAPVMWVSWPQACMTGTSVPSGNRPRAVLA
jgi:hypothetical protein